MSIAAPVMVFDSGSGGLSVWQEIVRLRRDLSTVYCADFEGFPYGTKADWQVAGRVTGLLQRLLPRYHPALVVLACNTASTLLLDDLRRRFDLPFVGVVPAIKTAAAELGRRRICLLATPATISRPYIDQLVKDFAPTHEVIKKGQGDLVRIAEDYIRGKLPADEFEAVVDEIRVLDVDTVVLGCTHFPLLRSLFEARLPAVKWIDSGQAIARRVSHLLGAELPGGAAAAWHEAVYSGPYDHAWEVGALAFGFHQVAVLPPEQGVSVVDCKEPPG
jgi:glutamate racemase